MFPVQLVNPSRPDRLHIDQTVRGEPVEHPLYRRMSAAAGEFGDRPAGERLLGASKHGERLSLQRGDEAA